MLAPLDGRVDRGVERRGNVGTRVSEQPREPLRVGGGDEELDARLAVVRAHIVAEAAERLARIGQDALHLLEVKNDEAQLGDALDEPLDVEREPDGRPLE